MLWQTESPHIPKCVKAFCVQETLFNWDAHLSSFRGSQGEVVALLRGHSVMSGDVNGLTLGGVLLASSRKKPGMLLNIL